MTKKLIFSMFTIIMLHALAGVAQAAFPAIVTRIIDGDSIIVKTEKNSIEVRLYGIDAPEWKQSFASVSRKYLNGLILKKKIMLYPQYRDSYGRLVALLVHNDQSINGKMVEDGMAWVYPRYCRKKICKTWRNVQQIAEKEGRGLWRTKDPVSPWRWRSLKRAN